MYPKQMYLKAQKAKGNALMTAIFVIIVMSLLGAALVKMFSAQSESVVYEVYGTRALQAAQIGAQLQLQAIFPLNDNGNNGDCNLALQNLDLSGAAGFPGCRVASTTCVRTEVDDPDTAQVPDVDYWVINAIGECAVGNQEEGEGAKERIVTSRQVEVQARRYR